MFDRLLKAASKTKAVDSNHGAAANVKSGAVQPAAVPAAQTTVPGLQSVLAATSVKQRQMAIDAWIAAGAPTAELRQAIEQLQQRDSGAAKRLRQEVQDRKSAQDQGEREQQLLAQAAELLDKPDLRAQDLAQLDQRATGLKSAALDDVRSRLRQRLTAQTLLQQQLRDWHTLAREWQTAIQRSFDAPMADARAASTSLRERRETLLAEAERYAHEPEWAALPSKVQAAVMAHKGEINAEWQRFESELSLALAADSDAEAPLPGVRAWAAELQASRRAESSLAERERVQRLEVGQQRSREQHQAAIDHVMERLLAAEQALQEGHVREAQKRLDAIRSEGVHLPGSLVERINNARSGVYDLLAWQRWRADQIRAELCEQAEALAAQPLPVREQAEAVRELRERWKLLAREGEPTASLWPRFDAACTQAYEPVAAHIEQERLQFEAVEKLREGLIRELSQLAERVPPGDWRALSQALDRMSERWRTAGALPDKRLFKLQRAWDSARARVAAPLEAARAESIALREQWIAQAEQAAAGQAPGTADLFKDIQARWQRESQRVPLGRKHDQELWQRLRTPIDGWFAAREQAREARQRERDQRQRAFADARQSLSDRLGGTDRQAIRAALDALETAADALAGGAERGLPPAVLRELRESQSAAQQRLRELEVQSRLGGVERLLEVWRARNGELAGDRKAFTLSLGPKFKTAMEHWLQAAAAPPRKDAQAAAAALLRLEIVADVPSPPEAQMARRAMQLKILAERSRPILEAQWGKEVEAALQAPFDDALSGRLMTVLRRLLS